MSAALMSPLWKNADSHKHGVCASHVLYPARFMIFLQKAEEWGVFVEEFVEVTHSNIALRRWGT